LGGSALRALVLSLVAFPAFSADLTHYRSPVAAADAVLEALRNDDAEALGAIFGPHSQDLLSSGDEVADREARRRFLEAADVQLCIEREGEDRAILGIDSGRWPFPIPLVRGEQGWYFDTAAGAEEIINRRIGRNELHAIATVRAYVDAQYEYYRRAPEGDARYAERLRSGEGRRDGLYWPSGPDEAESPLGPLVAQAVEEGYGGAQGRSPYHGYFFRILTGQGPHAPGGAKSYISGGGMTDGFALVAYPAEHGNSGIMTFIVNQRGIVYQKDLGPGTSAAAEAMTAFDPDASWAPVAAPEI
jgi:hypothetical protein